MYKFSLGEMLFPITPSSVEIKDNFNNKTINLINEGEVNLIKEQGLKEISFEATIPDVEYPFAVQSFDKFQKKDYYIDYLKKYERSKKPLNFLIFRKVDAVVKNKKTKKFSVSKTNLLVTIESLTWKEDAENGRDLVVSISLKEYKDYHSKKLKIKKDKKCSWVWERVRVKKSPAKLYVVKNGDCLYNIAKKQLNNASKWKEIYKLNQKTIESAAKKHGRKSSLNGHYIYPGTKLKLPK